ncbi:MAG TPA: SDR family NAD(P)-dependent oxidoreductase [Dehalococcoidales bacterium]|nr:SDR family NAD(P)-dependent oxidoreductase [Dehalococcoidales bacterium]
MDNRFAGKAAVVTGSARGIGQLCAKILLESGAGLALVDILDDRLKESEKTPGKKDPVKGYPAYIIRVVELPA